MQRENQKNQSPEASDGSIDESDALLAAITPEDEKAMLRETRKRAAKLYGFTKKDLDSLYGKEE